MELRAIIIDDEIDGIKSLKLLIERFVKEVNVIAEEQLSLLGCAYKIAGTLKKIKAVIMNRL